ncbi:MAG: protein kinase [Calditrichaceae bacterium]
MIRSISHYHIIEQIGEGGMGVVYLAEDTKLERQVAIKFLPRQVGIDPKEKERFKTEAKAAASLNNPNIATIHAIEEVDDEIFIVMEYINGQELKDIIHDGREKSIDDIKTPPISPEDMISYAIQAATGLNTAHEKGIIHRDIKSSNIMLTRDGIIKIMDFGLAKIRGNPQLTIVGSTLGTAAYMSPEQAKGDEADQRSDIWSFGVVLYELATGEVPFSGSYEQAVMYSIVNDEPVPVLEINQDVPPRLARIISKCLEKEPGSRYQNMREVLTDLKNINSDEIPDTLTRAKAAKGVGRPVSFSPKTIKISAMVIIIILAGMILTGRFGKISTNILSSDVPEAQHLLVLPLTNIGGDPGQAALCDGLAEILTSNLSQLEQFHGSLWVVPFSEVRRNGISSPGEARRIFGANIAVTGSLQLLKDVFRLTLTLIDASTLRQISSTVIDVNESDLTLLQDRSVGKLMTMLNLRLNPESHKVLREGGTGDPLAYEFYLQGRGYLQRYEEYENIDAAISLFSQALKRDSLYAQAHAGLGEAYWRKFYTSKEVEYADLALVSCEKAFALNARLAPVNTALGMVHAGTGKYEEAVGDFSRALEINPTDADAYRGLANAYESQELFNEAEVTFKKAIELKPDYWAGYNDLGVYYYRHGRFEEAIQEFQNVIRLTPDNSRGYNNIGGIYYMQEKWEKAEEMFEQSFRLHKSYLVASNLGTLYYIEGKFKQAAEMYRTALEMNENDFLIWGNLASAIYWIPEERKNARKYYQKAIELAEKQRSVNPNDPNVVSRLAGYYAMTGNRSKAELMIESAIRLAPNSINVMYEAGTVYEQLGDRKKAIDWIGMALENGYSKSEILNQPELRELLADDSFKRYLK